MHPPIAGAVLVAEHVHERAVVDAMHAERPDEVALQHPERLGQQERARDLGGDPIDDLAPELGAASRASNIGLRDGVLGARRDAAARARAPATTAAGCAAWRAPSRHRSG